jgi:hypothetical protein
MLVAKRSNIIVFKCYLDFCLAPAIAGLGVGHLTSRVIPERRTSPKTSDLRFEKEERAVIESGCNKGAIRLPEGYLERQKWRSAP